MKMSIKAIRVNAGFTQQQVADRLGIGLQTYVRKETGVVKWWAREIAEMAEMFDTDIRVFFSSLEIAD